MVSCCLYIVNLGCMLLAKVIHKAPRTCSGMWRNSHAQTVIRLEAKAGDRADSVEHVDPADEEEVSCDGSAYLLFGSDQCDLHLHLIRTTSQKEQEKLFLKVSSQLGNRAVLNSFVVTKQRSRRRVSRASMMLQ